MLKNVLRRIFPRREEKMVGQQAVLLITQEKVKLNMFKDVADVVQDVLQRGGTLRLLLEEGIPFHQVKRYILNIENGTPDFLVVLDWEDRATSDIYKTYLLPNKKDEQISFVEKRVLLIYDSCEALGISYQAIVRKFVAALGLHLDESYFSEMESWMKQAAVADHHPVMERQFLRIQFSREEVEEMDITGIARIMDSLTADSRLAAQKKNSMIFSFYGFAGNLEDLLDQEDIRSWASYVVEKYPYIFYFLNDEEVPMTRFLTSLVVSSQMEGDTLYYHEEELKEFFHFIQQSLIQFAQWVGEDPDRCLEEFYAKFQENPVI